MSRIRNVKPEFFRHEGLQDLEKANPGKYPMFVFEGIWTKCDRQGIFEWKPRSLKLDILPFLDFDMEETMRILENAGYIERYEIGGKEYGIIHTFKKHQFVSKAEWSNKNVFPLPQNQPETVPKQTSTIEEPLENGFETVLEQVENYGVLNSEYGELNSDNGNSEDGSPEKSECDFSEPQKLFLHIWQTTPGNVFNSLARIEKPKDWARFWSTAPPSCEEVRRVMQNVIDDVNCGALERRYIPGTPDRFVLGGGFQRHQARYKPDNKKTSPPPNLAGKKSLGGLET